MEAQAAENAGNAALLKGVIDAASTGIGGFAKAKHQKARLSKQKGQVTGGKSVTSAGDRVKKVTDNNFQGGKGSNWFSVEKQKDMLKIRKR
jgi:hypothetical protein